MEIKDPRIDLNCTGLQMLSMTATGTKATGHFTLPLYPDDGNDPDNAGKPPLDCYQILFTNTDGHTVRRPVRYHVDVDRDLKPVIEIVEPRVEPHQEYISLPEDGQLRIRVHSFDPDFALRHVTLQARREAQAGREAENLGLPELLNRTKPDKAMPKPFDGEYIFRPADLKLKAGDQVTYWATAEDNKEPPQTTPIRRTERSTSSSRDRAASRIRKISNAPMARRETNDDKTSRPGKGDQTGKPSSDSTGKGDSENASGDKSNTNGQGGKPQDPQSAGDKNKGQPNSGARGQDKTSPEEANRQNGGEPNPGDAGDDRKRLSPETQQADAIRDILKHEQEQEQKKAQPNKPDQPSGDQQKPDQPQDPGQKGDNQPQNGSQGGQEQTGNQKNQQQAGDKDGQKQSGDKGGQPQAGDKGGQQSQGNSAKKQDQNGSPGGQQSQGDKQDSGQSPSGQNQSAQGDSHDPSGQNDSRPSTRQGSPGSKSDGGAQSQGNQDSANQPSGNQPSSQNSSGKGNESKPSAGSKKARAAVGSRSPMRKHLRRRKRTAEPVGGRQPEVREATARRRTGQS